MSKAYTQGSEVTKAPAPRRVPTGEQTLEQIRMHGYARVELTPGERGQPMHLFWNAWASAPGLQALRDSKKHAITSSPMRSYIADASNAGVDIRDAIKRSTDLFGLPDTSWRRRSPPEQGED